MGCCNTGTIIATTSTSSQTHGAGAIAGGTAGCAISDCYNTGVLRATSSKGRASVQDGPFVGVRFAHSAPWTASYTVKTSYNIGKMLGRKDAADYEDYCVYYNDEGTLVELSALELCSQFTYEGFDFTDVWQMGNEDTYLMPTLQWFEHPAVPENTTDFDGGTGTIFDPYLVSTKAHLDHVRDYPQGYFKLTEDLVFTEEDFSETGAFYNDGQGWLSIGDAEVPFIGTLDGNGHTIQGLYQSSTKAHNDYYGLFGNAEGIEIRDLNVVDSCISVSYVGASNGYTYTGFLVGHTTNCTIENCLSTGVLTASSNKISSLRFGGILGSGNAVNLMDCSNVGNLSYTGNANAYFGGIMGEGSGTITNCRNMGAISVKAGAGKVGSVAVENGSWIIPAKEHSDDENDSDHACDVCGKEDVSMHTPGTERLEDQAYHWHICIVSGCGEVVESTKAPHTPDHDGGATEEYAVKCTVCDYVMEQKVIHSHVFDKQVADSKYLKYAADCERAAAYYYSCACGQVGDESFNYGSANGHTYIYGVCHCGDDILPEIAYDEGTGAVELEEIPSEVRRVIVAVYTGEKMLYGTVAGDDPVVIPTAMLQQADGIRAFYLDDQYTPVLMAGYHLLINR